LERHEVRDRLKGNRLVDLGAGRQILPKLADVEGLLGVGEPGDPGHLLREDG
jgi:hypothetical protein